ncbi:MAG TPA: alpha/beta hydrolase-fold protein [Candidatus Polarisedimenticolaceae bacterium]|nr:alpha/beta hydrolase-fold protein [Candidatus Polarisedimenticolaceae bacterium]
MTRWLDYDEVYEGGATRVAGTVKVLKGVESRELGNTRDLLVYLPPSHGTANRTYPTLYMHDGQNLFDAATSYAGEWRADETLEALAGEGIEAIVVGIPNSGTARLAEYSPFEDKLSGAGRARDYVRFVVETVKPLVDDAFRTTGLPEATATIGSSMGGLVSLYAFFERPDVFGLVGAVSPSLGFARQAPLAWLESAPFVGGRIYMDVGTLEGPPRAGDEPSPYVRLVRRAYDALVSKGYAPDRDILYREDEGGRHNEAAWAARLPEALRFLLK